MKKYVLAIDQGTTSTCLILVNKKGNIVYKDSIKIKQYFNDKDEILQDPNEIYLSVKLLIKRLFENTNYKPSEINSIGITNQRETTVIWNKKTNKEIYPAISWQSTNTKYITNKWEKHEKLIYEKTGLKISPYFSASKIKHILNNTNENIDDLLFGTIDTYLLYRLTNGKYHKTDVTNASRTMLYNINTKKWDLELLEIFNIPKSILPTVHSNDHYFGEINIDGINIPITTLIGDQQASLFGHQCFNEGDSKITYGTGCFILMNIGNNKIVNNNLLKTIFYDIDGKTKYAVEGSIFMGGSSITWMKDKLNLVNDPKETEKMALLSNDNSVYVVPAFSGLGTPYWDNEIKGSILGLKANTNKNDIIKATLNSIAFQVCDVLFEVKNNTNIYINNISVDGGVTKNNYLMQFQADLLKTNLIKTKEIDITALGAAYISGLSSNFYKDINDLKESKNIEKIFIPKKDVTNLYKNWQLAVKATKKFKI